MVFWNNNPTKLHYLVSNVNHIWKQKNILATSNFTWTMGASSLILEEVLYLNPISAHLKNLSPDAPINKFCDNLHTTYSSQDHNYYITSGRDKKRTSNVKLFTT